MWSAVGHPGAAIRISVPGSATGDGEASGRSRAPGPASRVSLAPAVAAVGRQTSRAAPAENGADRTGRRCGGRRRAGPAGRAIGRSAARGQTPSPNSTSARHRRTTTRGTLPSDDNRNRSSPAPTPRAPARQHADTTTSRGNGIARPRDVVWRARTRSAPSSARTTLGAHHSSCTSASPSRIDLPGTETRCGFLSNSRAHRAAHTTRAQGGFTQSGRAQRMIRAESLLRFRAVTYTSAERGISSSPSHLEGEA